MIAPLIGMIDRAVLALLAVGRWLIVPLALLLFLQWPLREGLHLYSAQANDLGQILFSLYVSLAVTDATRSGTHLASDAVSQRYSPGLRQRLARLSAILFLLPWSVATVVAGLPGAVRSAAQLEHFPDTDDPGYFVLRVGVCLLAALVALQALIDVVRAPRPR